MPNTAFVARASAQQSPNTTGRGEAGLEDAASAHMLLTSEYRMSLGTLIDWRRAASNPLNLCSLLDYRKQVYNPLRGAPKTRPSGLSLLRSLRVYITTSVSGRSGDGPC